MQDNSIFITIGIPTFNRDLKLIRLLNQFINLQTDIDKNTIEILVSNNHSDDDTENLVLELIPCIKSLGYKVSYYQQPINIGFDRNVKFLYDRAEGEYVWLFGDDDILIEESFDDVINDLKKFKPAVCLSSFMQPPYNEKARTFMFENGADHKLVTEIGESIHLITKYIKITIYILRKFSLDKYQSAISQVLDKGFSHAIYGFLCYFEEGTLLVRTQNIAKNDDEYLSIRYSIRVMLGLYDSFEIALKEIDRSDYLSMVCKSSSDEIFRSVLSFLRKYYQKQITLPSEVVKSDESYIKNNLHLVFHSPKNLVHFLQFLPYFLIKNIVI